MARIFGFDIGTTSIGSAVIDYDLGRGRTDIARLASASFRKQETPTARRSTKRVV